MNETNVKVEFDTEEVMGEQKNTICIEGQEIPTYQYIWEILRELEKKVKRLLAFAAVITILATTFITLVMLWKTTGM